MMQLILFGTYILAASIVQCQLWNDPSSGIMVKTLYLPLRKGNSAISLQDLNRSRQLTAFNLPYFPVKLNPDPQQASTLNQNYAPKVKLYESNVQPIQDVKPKVTNYPKSELQSQVSNLHGPYQASSFPQQQYNTVLQPGSGNALNHNAEAQQPYYQQQYVSNYMSAPLQNFPHQNNYSNTQHHNSGFHNGNSVQDGHISTNGVVQNVQSQGNYGQIYPSGNFVTQKYTVSNAVNTESHNLQNNQAQSIQYVNSPNHDSIKNSQNPQVSFSGESSRFLHQMQSETNPIQPTSFITSTTQRPSYVSSHHQIGFGIQNHPVTQQVETNVVSNNQYNIPQAQENRNSLPSQSQQLQQSPVSAYAIVHQRIANNNFAPHDNRATFQLEQNRVSNFKQTSEGPSLSPQTSYSNNGPSEYIKPSPNQGMTFQMNEDVPQNYVENSQYIVKPEVPVSVPNQQNNGYPAAAQMQVMSQQYPQGQQDSQERQYFNQQPTASSFPVVQSHNPKPKVPQQQNLIPQVSYPDPSSETFYPENKQVYLAPPSDYSSQGQQHQQQQAISQQNFVRYPSQSETSAHYSQIPVSVQTEQLGIHISVPNRSFA